MDQKRAVHEREWRYLVVLDACRYDYFDRVYSNYLDGDLFRMSSLAFEGTGAATTVWYQNTFCDRYPDITHVSSHPRVNSKMAVDGYDARDHFGEIIDVWAENWDDEYGTVFPEDLTRRAIEVINDRPDNRFIIHYMQPHVPYITLDPPDAKTKERPESNKFLENARKGLVGIGRSFVGDATAARFMGRLGLPPLSPLDDALRKVGEEGVKRAYCENLEATLKNVRDLRGKVSGPMVVTGDHGELLGEYGRFGHATDAYPELTEVPWLEM